MFPSGLIIVHTAGFPLNCFNWQAKVPSPNQLEVLFLTLFNDHLFLRRCIYILDHHCFFLGHCVGRKNQKFFLVFCFYAAIGCSIGVYHVFYTLTNYRVFWSKVILIIKNDQNRNIHITGCNFLLPPILNDNGLHW